MDGKHIKDILKEAGVSQAELAAALGTSPQNLNSALSGDNVKTGILEQVAEYLGKPISFFYDGELPENIIEQGETFRVPLIPTEAHAGSLTGFAESINDYDCETIVSPVRGASFAIQVTGESMSPAYPSGARILCQRIDEAAFIEWGKVYLLDTVNGAILKQVRKADTPDRVVCHSLNPAPEYAPFEIELRHITAWFRVLMILNLV